MKIREENRDEEWGTLGDFAPGDVVAFGRGSGMPGYYLIVNKLELHEPEINVVNIESGFLHKMNLMIGCREVCGEFVLTGEKSAY